MRGCATVALLALATCGCASIVPLDYRPDDPPGVFLPAKLAGVRDERAQFATMFGRELRASLPEADVTTWLHGVQPHAATTVNLDVIDRRFAQLRSATAVLVVPGLFGDCVDGQSMPFGDGVPRPREIGATEAYAQYADLGVHAIRRVPLPGRASSAHNGELLAGEIRAEAQRSGVERIVIVAYSKGVPDVLHALHRLQQDGGVPRKVVALVSVAGVVMGTPIADRFERFYGRFSPRGAVFGCSEADGDELSSITRRERLAWLDAHPPPAGIAYHSVVAYAAAHETALPLRPAQAMLDAIDPRNDGQLLAGDAVLPGSALLATARSDHWDIALPRNRHPDALVRAMTSGRAYPREALFRAMLKWVVGRLH